MKPEDTHLIRFIREEVRRLIREDKYEYDSVERDAEPQPEVKQAVERFRDMDPSERDTNVLLWWLLGSGTPPYKMSQEDSQYSDTAGTAEEACANCDFLYQKVTTGEYICSQIRGKVRPGGWCNLWAPAEYLQDND
jgi:hypothetical protein